MVSERIDYRWAVLCGTFGDEQLNMEEKKGSSMTFADILKGKDKARRAEHNKEYNKLLEQNRQMAVEAQTTESPPIDMNKLSQAISQGKADEVDPTGALLRDVMPPDADGTPIDEKLLALNIRIQQQREERCEQLEIEKKAIEGEIAAEERAIRMTKAAIEAADRKPVMGLKV